MKQSLDKLSKLFTSTKSALQSIPELGDLTDVSLRKILTMGRFNDIVDEVDPYRLMDACKNQMFVDYLASANPELAHQIREQASAYLDGDDLSQVLSCLDGALSEVGINAEPTVADGAATPESSADDVLLCPSDTDATQVTEPAAASPGAGGPEIEVGPLDQVDVHRSGALRQQGTIDDPCWGADYDTTSCSGVYKDFDTVREAAIGAGYLVTSSRYSPGYKKTFFVRRNEGDVEVLTPVQFYDGTYSVWSVT